MDDIEYLSEQKHHIVCETIFVGDFIVLGYSETDVRKLDGRGVERLHILLV